MLPAVLELLLLISGLLAFSALIGFVLFGPWDPPLAAFASYGSSFYSSFLLLTTTNFPDVALRPYRSSRATVLYFVLFQLTLVFVGLALMLARLEAKCLPISPRISLDPARGCAIFWLAVLEAECVFVSPNQRSGGHVSSRIRPHSALFTVCVPLGIHAVL